MLNTYCQTVLKYHKNNYASLKFFCLFVCAYTVQSLLGSIVQFGLISLFVILILSGCFCCDNREFLNALKDP